MGILGKAFGQGRRRPVEREKRRDLRGAAYPLRADYGEEEDDR
jgi:hypothetical protein